MKYLEKDKKNKLGQSAFTLVELVVVIAVIVILATLVIVGFGAWRTRVAETEVNSDLLNVQAAMEDARNRTDTYPIYTPGTVFDGTNSTRALFKQSEHVTMTYESGSALTYCITAQSDEVSSVSMYVDISFALRPLVGSC